MYEDKIKHLEEAHRVLDQKIDTLEKNGLFEDIKMQELKKQRLLFRDELAILRHKQYKNGSWTMSIEIMK